MIGRNLWESSKAQAKYLDCLNRKLSEDDYEGILPMILKGINKTFRTQSYMKMIMKALYRSIWRQAIKLTEHKVVWGWWWQYFTDVFKGHPCNCPNTKLSGNNYEGTLLMNLKNINKTVRTESCLKIIMKVLYRYFLKKTSKIIRTETNWNQLWRHFTDTFEETQ